MTNNKLPKIGQRYKNFFAGDFEVIEISNNTIKVKHKNGQTQRFSLGVFHLLIKKEENSDV